MKIFVLLVGLLLPILCNAASAPTPSAPILAAKSYLLYDYNSNQILASHNAEARIDPTSFSKLMTAYVVLDAIKQGRIAADQVVGVPASALRTSGSESRMFLRAEQPVTIEELLHGLVVSSANDAALTLAICVAGAESRFVELMNQQAQQLGMRNTQFTNPAGFPDGKQRSNAYDLAMLAAGLARNFPEHQSLFAKKENTFNGVVQMSRNRLLWLEPFADGMAVAQQEGGYSSISSALRDKHRLISVVIAANTDNLRSIESQKLLNYGFQHFDLVKLYQKDQAVTQVRIWRGIDAELELSSPRDLYVTIPKGRANQLKASIEVPQPLFAPISAGQTIGTLKLTLSGKPYAEHPLLARTTVPLANVFSRGWDGIRLFFQ